MYDKMNATMGKLSSDEIIFLVDTANDALHEFFFCILFNRANRVKGMKEKE